VLGGQKDHNWVSLWSSNVFQIQLGLKFLSCTHYIPRITSVCVCVFHYNSEIM
jgi:hypothetical protein